MAYERTSDENVVGSGLDTFVENAIKGYQRQLSIRNAKDEARFNELVLAEDLSLDGQLDYRRRQLGRVKDDPEETRRVTLEIAALKDKIQQKEYSDAYLDKLIDFESGATSLDGVISFLRDRLATTTDENIRKQIRESLATQEGARFELSQTVLKAQTDYALQDRRVDIIDDQIKRVDSARVDATLAGNDELATMYDLQMRTLRKARAESEIEKASTDFAVGTMAGYQSSTALLDSYNARIADAADDGPVDIGGKRYDSARQFWTYRRDSYIADESANGFFSRFKDERVTAMNVKQSSNTLTNGDVRAFASDFDNLTARPELQSYAFKINAYRQDVVQTGADLRTSTIENRYVRDLDVNRAFAELDSLKNLGANVDESQTSILSRAAQLKETQVSNILATAQQIMKDNPGMKPDDALAEAAKSGAGVVLSPEQLVSKTETEIASEFEEGARTGTFGTEPRTTAGAAATKTATEGAAPIVAPQEQDISDRYGIVGKTVYRKSDGRAFASEQEFFQDSGLTSFQNVKFDTAYQPPSGGSQKLDLEPAAAVEPAAAPEVVTYKVQRGDTLSAIAGRMLGDANRYQEIAKENNLADPDRIVEGQELKITKK